MFSDTSGARIRERRKMLGLCRARKWFAFGRRGYTRLSNLDRVRSRNACSSVLTTQVEVNQCLMLGSRLDLDAVIRSSEHGCSHHNVKAADQQKGHGACSKSLSRVSGEAKRGWLLAESWGRRLCPRPLTHGRFRRCKVATAASLK